LRPIAPKHHRHTPLRVVAGRIVVAADLLPGRHVERCAETAVWDLYTELQYLLTPTPGRR